jgi:hypothetical protein
VEWHGHVSVQPIESDGEFQIDGLQAHTIWEYLEDRLNFLVNSGSIDLNATYKFALRDTVDLQVNLAKIAVANLAVRARDADVDWVTLPQLLVSNTSVDLGKQTATVDSFTLTGLKLNQSHEAGSRTGTQRWSRGWRGAAHGRCAGCPWRGPRCAGHR